MKKFVRIRTQNSTARPLRRSILVDDWTVVRLGSLTSNEVIREESGIPRRERLIEINTPDSVRNSSSKLRMKRCFASLNVPQADGWTTRDGVNFDSIFGRDEHCGIGDLPYPIVAKRVFGCQGKGMRLLKNRKTLEEFLGEDHDLYAWIFEEFYNYGREYRLHVGHGVGVFMSWRKLRRNDTEEDRWFFNNVNSNWVGPKHAAFDKPKCWKKMVKAAKDALDSCGLDIGACDIRVQTSRQEDPQFIICEINSAPSLGDFGIEKYREVIKKIIKVKKDGK